MAFSKLLFAIFNSDCSNLVDISSFVGGKTVVVYSSMICDQSARFLIRLILKLGKFNTQRDVFEGASSSIECFNRAGIDTSDKECLQLVTYRFVVEQA